MSLSLLFFSKWCWGFFWSEFLDSVAALYVIMNQVHVVMKVGLNVPLMFKKTMHMQSLLRVEKTFNTYDCVAHQHQILWEHVCKLQRACCHFYFIYVHVVCKYKE